MYKLKVVAIPNAVGCRRKAVHLTYLEYYLPTTWLGMGLENEALLDQRWDSRQRNQVCYSPCSCLARARYPSTSNREKGTLHRLNQVDCLFVNNWSVCVLVIGPHCAEEQNWFCCPFHCRAIATSFVVLPAVGWITQGLSLSAPLRWK